MNNLMTFLAGFCLAIGITVGLARVQAAAPAPTVTPTLAVSTETPTARPTATARPTRTATPTAQPSPTQPALSVAGVTFGWPGEIQCYNCSPFSQRVHLTHYNPNRGDINCWAWSEEFNWCMSPTFIGVPWESVWGFGAACPGDWPVGTWVELDGIGHFICFDHGDMVTCNEDHSLCNVDLLGPGGAAWDGKDVDATLWVPLKPRK